MYILYLIALSHIFNYQVSQSTCQCIHISSMSADMVRLKQNNRQWQHSSKVDTKWNPFMSTSFGDAQHRIFADIRFADIWQIQLTGDADNDICTNCREHQVPPDAELTYHYAHSHRGDPLADAHIKYNAFQNVHNHWAKKENYSWQFWGVFCCCFFLFVLHKFATIIRMMAFKTGN